MKESRLWGVPEDETLSWGWEGEEREREVSPRPWHWLGSSPLPHPPTIHNPPPLAPCKEDGGPAVSAPGRPQGDRVGTQTQAHTTCSHLFIQQMFTDILLGRAPETNQSRAGPQRAQSLGGEAGCEGTTIILDSEPHEAGSRWSLAPAAPPARSRYPLEAC